MGAKPSCMEGGESPNVVLKVRASCCNRTVRISINETEKIKSLLEYVSQLSDGHVVQETTL